MKKHFAIVFCLMTISTFGIAQKYSNEFMNIGVGARAQAMGNAQVASVEDSYAGYWNPAGLANLKTDLQVSAMHTEWFAGVGNYDYASVAYKIPSKDPLKRRSIGLSFVRFGIDDIPNTLSLYEDDGTVNYSNVLPFSAADYGFLLSYSESFYVSPIADFSIGGNVKVIYREIGPFAKAYGFGLDLGAQLQMEKWKFGLMVRDLTNTFNAWSFSFTEEEKEILALTNNNVPISSLEVTKPQVILGAAYNHSFGKFNLATELNTNITLDGQRNTLVSTSIASIDPSLGVEANYNRKVFLRAGVNQFQKETNMNGEENWTLRPNLGVGVRLLMLKIDYAYTDIGSASEKTYSHVISLLVGLNFKSKQKSSKNQDIE